MVRLDASLTVAEPLDVTQTAGFEPTVSVTVTLFHYRLDKNVIKMN